MGGLISYSIELRWASHDNYRYYKNISPDEIKEAAKLLGYKGNGLSKLINHTSKKYTFIKTKDLYIDKHFHDEICVYESFYVQHDRNLREFNIIHNV